MPALRTRDTQSRALEVTTDAPQPPVLNIVSPTPRAFTFPISHNLSSDSPYSSPSQSPFEPDLRSLPSVSQCTTPPLIPASFTRTLSPDSSFRSASPISMHKRRKSSCSSDIVERRPKKGDEDYIKRPENAFILFRRKCCEERHAAMEEADGPTKKQRQADLSKTISQQWKGLSPEDRKYWEDLAKEKKKEHEQMYPNYVYRPQRAKDRDGRSKNNKKSTKGLPEETDSEGVSFVLPMAAPRHHGRSASAPTPPPYTIQVPTVYMTPSCPTSPSLLPMISRRSSHTGNPEEAMSNFDFVPNNNYLSPSYGQPMESSINQSEFLRSMWDMPASQRHDLQPLNLSPPTGSGLLPAHQIISPSSAVISPSSSISDALTSPESSPYTPSTGASHNFVIPSGDINSSPESDHDLQLEMQMQNDFASFSWQSATNHMWNNADGLLGDDFELGAIPPIEIGMQKFNEDMGLGGATGLEFGQDFVQALEGTHFNEGGILSFDDMMAGQGF